MIPTWRKLPCTKHYDLVDICTDNIKMFLFADDAKMYRHVRDIVDKDKLQSGIDKFVKWTVFYYLDEMD